MIELDERDFTSLCLCAFRYALERTGVSYDISDLLLRKKGGLCDWAKEQIKRDIHVKIQSKEFKNTYDLENWKVVLTEFSK